MNNNAPFPASSVDAAPEGGFAWGRWLLLVVVMVLGYGVYMRVQPSTGQGQGFGAPAGPVPVNVITVVEQKARLWTPFSARLTAVEQAEIRPQVGGRITKVQFNEGAWVKKGQPLFVIDPRPYQAQVNRAEAAVAAAETKLQLAHLELTRAQALVAKNAIAQSVLETRESDFQVAQSDVLAARAQLLQASVNLDYAYVESPIAGRVGRPELTVGNVVEVVAARALPLTTVVDTRTLYAEFNVDEHTYIALTSDLAPGQKKLPVRMTLGVGGSPVYEGTLLAFDNSFNTSTGTIRARAVFDNKNGALVPGLFASVILGTAQEHPVLTVPEAAINTDQTRKYVLVVDSSHHATYREVTLGAQVEGGQVITSGLTVGDKVVVSGLQRVRPGALVQPLTPFDKTGLVVPEKTTPAPEVKTVPPSLPAPDEKPAVLDAVFKDATVPPSPSQPTQTE